MRDYKLSNHEYLYLLNSYTNIEEAGSYGSLQDLWYRIQEDGNPYNLRKKQVEIFMQNLDVYTMHSGVRRSYITSRIFTRHIQTNLHFDYFLMLKQASSNNSIKYILIALDSLSRMVYLQPVIDRTANSFIKAFTALLENAGFTPVSVYSDMAGEFLAKKVKDFFKKLNIRTYFSKNEHHSFLVERACRSIKAVIYRYLHLNMTSRYIDKLQFFADNYNWSVHRSIRTKPALVDHSNEFQVWLNSYWDYFRHQLELSCKMYKYKHLRKKFKNTKVKIRRDYRKKYPKLKSGQLVRIMRWLGSFKKYYEPNFSAEVYRVERILKGYPPRYVLFDFVDNSELIGYFYISELRRVEFTESSKKASIAGSNYSILAIIKTHKGAKSGNIKYLAKLQKVNRKGEIITRWIRPSNIINVGNNNTFK